MQDRYDMLVIGGGIHGVGVAQAAAAAGYDVALVEQRLWLTGHQANPASSFTVAYGTWKRSN